jgi:CheY-like chemotaxis protein
VLVVEDDDALRCLFTALFARHSYAMECVADGAEALERLSRCSYDVILLDLMMRGMNGFDVVHILSESRPELLQRTIIITGVSQRELEKLDRIAVFAIMRKPFDIDSLITAMIQCSRRVDGSGAAKDERNGALSEGESRDLDDRARRFEASVPALRTVLSSPAGSSGELLLRRELRRTMNELGAMFAAAALAQYDDRAERYERLGRAAVELARTPPAIPRHDN